MFGKTLSCMFRFEGTYAIILGLIYGAYKASWSWIIMCGAFFGLVSFLSYKSVK